MTRRRETPKLEEDEHAYLLVPRDEFAAELEERIQLGKALQERAIVDEGELDAARSDYYTWNEYNLEFLRRRFTTSAVADQYRGGGAGAFIVPLDPPPLREKVDDLRKDISRKVRRLESIREQLPLFEEAAVAISTAVARGNKETANKVETIFIVHGHNEAAKLAVHGFLRDVTPLDPVILHDEPSRGLTVIEKFESVGSTAAFAVVLLTADDEGRLVTDPPADLEARGRQNVVFEFGYFVGAIGRSRVAVLYEPDVELPSDVDGLVYIPYDPPGGWKVLLARELRAAGIDVDANKLL